MKLKFKQTLLPITVCLGSLFFMNLSYGPGNGGNRVTGAPFDDGTCTNCHSGGNFNASASLTLLSNGSPVTSYTAGGNYALRITRSATGNPFGFGFQLTCATSAPGNVNINGWGTPPLPGINAHPIQYYDGTSFVTRDYVEHNTPLDPMINQVDIPWTAPAGGTGNVTFYMALNTVNGAGNTGDQVVSTNLTVSECQMPDASNLSVSNISSTGLKLSFTRGGGTGAIVVARAGGQPSSPTAGGSYNVAVAGDFANANNPSIGASKVIYNGTAGGNINLTVKNLQPGERYYFKVFEFNGGCVDGSAPSINAETILAEPTASSKTLIFSNIKPYSFDLSWTNGKGSRRIVVLKEGTAVTGAPIDNTPYTAAAQFGNGSQLATGEYVVYNGSGNSASITGLKAFTTYHAAIFEYNGPNDLGNIDYRSISPAKAYKITDTDFVFITKTGSPYKQNFDDSLIKTGLSSRFPAGWHMLEGGTAANATYAAGSGASTTGNTYSFGTSGADSTDRALGSILTATFTASSYGVRFRNNTTVPITSLLVMYNGEQWRRGSIVSNSKDTLAVAYSTNATRLNNGTWTNQPALNFTSPITTTTATALNGNLPANRTAIAASITNLNLLPGQYIWLRFTDVDKKAGNGADDGLAVDDLVIVPFQNTVVSGTTGNGVVTSYNDLNIAGGNFSIDTTFTIKYGLNIAAGSALSLNNRKLTVSGEVYGTGTFTGSDASSLTIGGINLNQTIRMTPGSNTLYLLEIKGNATATLGNALDIATTPKVGSLKIGSLTANQPATLNTNGFALTLKSDSIGTAYIPKGFGAINGPITIERYLYTDSGSRWISHPFNNSITPASLSDDITLNYGATNGNIKYFDHTTATTSINAADINTAVTSITSSSFAWQPYSGIRISKPAGTEVLDYTGNVSLGNVSIPLTKGANTDFIVIGNPYPAGITMKLPMQDAVAAGYVANVLYQWNPLLGVGGAFTTIPASKIATTKLPMGATLVLDMNASTGEMNFTEWDKTTSSTTNKVLRMANEEEQQPETENPLGITLSIEKEGKLFDELYIQFDNTTEAIREKSDALKLTNPSLNFYTLSGDKIRLAVDTRPFTTGEKIDLGLNSKISGKFTIKTAEYNLPFGVELFLVDKLLGKELLLTANTTYTCNITDNESNRFSLRMGKAADTNLSTENTDITLSPNPAKDAVTIHTNNKPAQVRIQSVTGSVLLNQHIDGTTTTIPLSNFASGIYHVEITTTDGQKTVKQLVVQ